MPPLSRRTLSPEQAQARLEELCARSEQCTHELREKMRRWGISPSDADRVIADMSRRRFVDDSRYAGALVRDKVRFARWGRRKIVAALMAKRIERTVIEEALESIDADEYARGLRHVLEHKAASLDLSEYDNRLRLFRHGIARGYESPLVSAEVKRLARLQHDAAQGL